MDEIVGDDAESHPALHPVQAAITATIQSVAAFQHADAAFAPGPPSLSGAEPTPLLQLPPFFAVRAAVGDGHPRPGANDVARIQTQLGILVGLPYAKGLRCYR